MNPPPNDGAFSDPEAGVLAWEEREAAAAMPEQAERLDGFPEEIFATWGSAEPGGYREDEVELPGEITGEMDVDFTD